MSIHGIVRFVSHNACGVVRGDIDDDVCKNPASTLALSELRQTNTVQVAHYFGALALLMVSFACAGLRPDMVRICVWEASKEAPLRADILLC